jgi:hypothetical protein
MFTIRARTSGVVGATLLAIGAFVLPAMAQQDQNQTETQEQHCVLISGLLELPCLSPPSQSRHRESSQEGTGTNNQRQRQEQDQDQFQCFLCLP